MHIVLDTECSLHTGCPQNQTACPGFLLFPLLVSADTTTASDRSGSTTAMRSTSNSSIFSWRQNSSSKNNFHCALKKMVPHQHPIVTANFHRLHQTTAASRWCGLRPRLGWVKIVVGLPEGPSYPGHSPPFFRYAAH